VGELLSHFHTRGGTCWRLASFASRSRSCSGVTERPSGTCDCGRM
jgi:hypothetical protein